MPNAPPTTLVREVQLEAHGKDRQEGLYSKGRRGAHNKFTQAGPKVRRVVTASWKCCCPMGRRRGTDWDGARVPRPTLQTLSEQCGKRHSVYVVEARNSWDFVRRESKYALRFASSDGKNGHPFVTEQGYAWPSIKSYGNQQVPLEAGEGNVARVTGVSQPQRPKLLQLA